MTLHWRKLVQKSERRWMGFYDDSLYKRDDAGVFTFGQIRVWICPI